MVICLYLFLCFGVNIFQTVVKKERCFIYQVKMGDIQICSTFSVFFKLSLFQPSLQFFFIRFEGHNLFIEKVEYVMIINTNIRVIMTVVLLVAIDLFKSRILLVNITMKFLNLSLDFSDMGIQRGLFLSFQLQDQKKFSLLFISWQTHFDILRVS